MGSQSPDRVEAVRRLVAAHLPDYWVDSVVQIGEGTDNLAYEVNGKLIVRLTKEPDSAARAARVQREARLLAAVATPRGVAGSGEQACQGGRLDP
jgi:aminoglycoside phosphotransferase (APT) family kinase protein